MASIFTRIIRGELPAEKVYETETEVAFLDVNPHSEGHTLVVPKREVADFDALPPDDLRALIATTQRVVKGVTRAMNTPHYNLMLNNGPPAGQIIFHVHFHIIPRYAGLPRSGPRPLSEEKKEALGRRIREAIAGLAGP